MALILILLLIIAAFLLFNRIGDSNYAMSKVISNDFKTETVFESTRVFGADSFEIYQFSLEEPNPIENFEKIDKNYFLKFKNFKDMIEVEFNDPENIKFDKAKLLQTVSLIEDMDDSQYLYLESENMKYEIYVYSLKMNVGYYLMLKL